MRIGPQALARAALVTCGHYLPVGRSRALLQALTGIDVSTGFLAGVRGRAARKPWRARQLMWHWTRLVLPCGLGQLRVGLDDFVDQLGEVILNVAAAHMHVLATAQLGNISRQLRLRWEPHPVGQYRDHPQTVRESLPDLAVDPIGRGVYQPLTSLIAEAQPVWADDHQQHAAGPQPT